MKLIDLSQSRHKLGTKQYRWNPERVVSMSGRYLVDKYMVTNCEMVQQLWDSIPGSVTQVASGDSFFGKRLILLKYASQKGAVCPVHDTAATYIYLYQALIYANARSAFEGLTPVYTFVNTVHFKKGAEIKTQPDSSFYVYQKPRFFKNKDKAPKLWHVTIDPQSEGYRLPFYDEWEAFARGGDTTASYVWGNDKDSVLAASYAWFGDTSDCWGNTEISVGKLLPNSFGLYDMNGLAAEVVLSAGSPRFYSVCSFSKGGSACNTLDELRIGETEYYKESISGLRLVRKLK